MKNHNIDIARNVMQEDIKKREEYMAMSSTERMYMAIYSDPDLASILSENLLYIDDCDINKAMHYAATGNSNALLEMIRHK